MGTAERREREIQEMRRKILDTAMSLFIEDGHESVSIRAIADKIEYSPGTIYLYFKDKDHILYVLHEEGFAEMIRRQKEILPTPDPAVRLTKLGQAYVKFALENPQYYELMFIMKAPMKKIKTEWSCGYEAFNNLRSTVEDCIKAGKFDAPNLDAATVAIWSRVHGLCSLIIRDRLQMIPDEHLEHVIQQAMIFGQAQLLNR